VYEESCQMYCFIAFFYFQAAFIGLLVNGEKIVTVLGSSSSPSKITAAKGSSVWLHWNYTYIGDGPHGGVLSTTYREQIIGFKSNSQPHFQVLAKRTGYIDALTLEYPVHVLFRGRVGVISSNSTLIIHDLRYADGLLRFSSFVRIDVDPGGSQKTHTYVLQPNIALSIYGIPNFIAEPPSVLTVNEDSNLKLRIEMDGSPTPSADFIWPHVTAVPSTKVPSVQLRSFEYSATYNLKNIDASFCGRKLQTTLRNQIGDNTKSIRVIVLLKLNHAFDLKAKKVVASNCVQVTWNKAESGACLVKYEVVLSDASGNTLYAGAGYNIHKLKTCNLNVYTSAISVQLKVSFKGTEKVVEIPISAPAPTGTSTPSLHTTPVGTLNPVSNSNNSTTITGSSANIGLILGISLGVGVFLIILVGGILWCYKKFTTPSASMQVRSVDSSADDIPLEILMVKQNCPAPDGKDGEQQARILASIR